MRVCNAALHANGSLFIVRTYLQCVLSFENKAEMCVEVLSGYKLLVFVNLLRHTPYFFCKAATDDASSSVWCRKSNTSFSTEGEKKRHSQDQYDKKCNWIQKRWEGNKNRLHLFFLRTTWTWRPCRSASRWLGSGGLPVWRLGLHSCTRLMLMYSAMLHTEVTNRTDFCVYF